MGGGGPHGDPTNKIFPTPFIGCLLNFKLDGSEVLWHDAMETSNLVPCATEEEDPVKRNRKKPRKRKQETKPKQTEELVPAKKSDKEPATTKGRSQQ